MPTLLLTKGPEIYDGEKTASPTNIAAKKTETRSMFITLY
jgi:hypothetical protein